MKESAHGPVVNRKSGYARERAKHGVQAAPRCAALCCPGPVEPTGQAVQHGFVWSAGSAGVYNTAACCCMSRLPEPFAGRLGGDNHVNRTAKKWRPVNGVCFRAPYQRPAGVTVACCYGAALPWKTVVHNEPWHWVLRHGIGVPSWALINYANGPLYGNARRPVFLVTLRLSGLY